MKYIYHLSDDTNHDATLTFYIIDDIRKHPEIINKTLVFHSDNFQNQYKRKYTFCKLKKLAEKYQMVVLWCYGEAGDGRGLVDALSSFGCKQQLKHDIVANDAWFPGASEMVQFLTKHFENESDEGHNYIDQKNTAKLRKEANKKEEAFPIKPCRYFGNIHNIFYLKVALMIMMEKNRKIKRGRWDQWIILFWWWYYLRRLDRTWDICWLTFTQCYYSAFFRSKVSKGVAPHAIMNHFDHAVLAGEKNAEVVYLDSVIGSSIRERMIISPVSQMTFDPWPDHVTLNFVIVCSHFEFYHLFQVSPTLAAILNFCLSCPGGWRHIKKGFSTKIIAETKLGMRKTKMMVPTITDQAHTPHPTEMLGFQRELVPRPYFEMLGFQWKLVPRPYLARRIRICWSQWPANPGTNLLTPHPTESLKRPEIIGWGTERSNRC